MKSADYARSQYTCGGMSSEYTIHVGFFRRQMINGRITGETRPVYLIGAVFGAKGQGVVDWKIDMLK
jgi:hypothetical protein